MTLNSPLSKTSKPFPSSPTLSKLSIPDMRVTVPWLCAVRSLRSAVASNLDYFDKTISAQEKVRNRFYRCFSQLEDHITAIHPVIDNLSKNASRYDFDKVPANGFRSLLSVTDACLCHLVGTARGIETQREAFLFRKNTYLKDLEEYTKILGALRKMLTYAEKMLDQSDKASVFPKEGSKLIEAWFEEVETLNQEVFYGRSLGFQYCPSVHTALQTIVLAMAVCAETYRSWESWKPGSAKLATTIPNMFTTTRFIMNPELRAKQIVHTTRNADINFCKQFWGLTEASYMQTGLDWMLPSVAVNRVIELEPEMIYVPGADGTEVGVKPPTQNRKIRTRLISDAPYERRLKNQKKQSVLTQKESTDRVTKLPKSKILAAARCCRAKNFIGHAAREEYSISDDLSANGKPALSPHLLFQCHGGGFIAQSSKAHEVYLIKWARDLQIPVFCVDYALAPEDPYPKGLDEVVYAYAWAQKNAEKLGWTGEHACFVGDSAGANLVVGAALKASLKNLKMPDGILAAYGAYLVQYTPSPSRLLCLMDPLLPMGILTRCLAAYAGIPEPTCVGQVQGADDKVTQNNPPTTPEVSPPIANGDSPGNLRTTSSSTANLHALDDNDGPRTPTESVRNGFFNRQNSTSSHQKTSKWFGKGMTKLFTSLKAKPMEVLNEETPADPDAPVSQNEARKMTGESRVEPLPRFNFAAVSVEDPFLSPLLAEDHILAGLPPIYLVACHLDPLLDDSITFARRLDQLKKPVHLDVMNHLPHGFLNFALLSTEAAKATDLCARRIREILGLPMPPDSK